MGIKISQLVPGGDVTDIDEIPVSRGLETFKISPKQFVSTGLNVGGATAQVYAGESEAATTTLKFRTLSSDSESLAITTLGDTVLFSLSGQTPVKTRFFGDGTTTSFALIGNNSKNPNNYRVDIDGVLQEPNIDYNVAGSNVVFTAAPALSSKVVVVSNNLSTPIDLSILTQNSDTVKLFWDNNTRLLSAQAVANGVSIDTIISQLSSQLSSQISLLSSQNNIQTIINTTTTLSPGDSILADTSGGAFTINLPASPSNGARVQFADAKGTWATNNLTVGRNGSTIENLSENLICDSNNKMFTSVYNGVTWKVYLG